MSNSKKPAEFVEGITDHKMTVHFWKYDEKTDIEEEDIDAVISAVYSAFEERGLTGLTYEYKES